MDETVSLEITKNCNTGKIYNTRWVLEYAIRDYGMQIDAKKVKLASLLLKDAAFRIQSSDSKARLWEDEGKAAGVYFRALNEMIPQQKKNFVFSV